MTLMGIENGTAKRIDALALALADASASATSNAY
jgi:hypothetical protein